MTQDTYMQLRNSSNDELETVVRDMVKKRVSDVQDFTNLPNQFVKGRSTNRVPASSTDVQAGDLVGDVVQTTTAIYRLISNGGTPTWYKSTLATF